MHPIIPELNTKRFTNASEMTTDLKDNCIERLQNDEKSGDKNISQKPSLQRWRILKQV